MTYVHTRGQIKGIGGGRGIGATTAFLFAEEGAKVGIVDLREEDLKRTKAQAKEKGFELKIFVGDVSKKDQIEKVIRQLVQEFGRIQVLVAGALPLSESYFKR